MKKRSGRNLIRFFYHLLVVLVMAMPILSGLVRVIYVQSNINSKDSYYGDVINERENIFISDISQFSFNKEYFVFNPISNGSVSLSSSNSGINAISLTYNDNVYNNVWFHFYYADRNYFYVYSYETNDYVLRDIFTSALEFSFVFRSNRSMTQNAFESFDNRAFYYISYNDYSYLDNAFDYSLYKTMQDFTFHSDFRFTDIANGMLMTFDNNNLYIQYINFYINWVLTCAVISFAPYVLLSFYHLAIHLVDKFTRKGEDL